MKDFYILIRLLIFSKVKSIVLPDETNFTATCLAIRQASISEEKVNTTLGQAQSALSEARLSLNVTETTSLVFPGGTPPQSHIHAHSRARTHTRTCTHTHTRTHTSTHTHTHTHTHNTLTHTHTHTHTHIHL